MASDVMSDPLPENIEGQKVVHHRFDHGVDWQVNVSHLLAALAVLVVVVWFLTRDSDRDDERPRGSAA